MKNKQTVLTFILLTVLAVTANAQQYDPESDFRVTKQADGKSIVITEYLGKKQTVSIPPTIQGLPVTKLGSQAFFRQTNLTSVTIPNSITSIESFVFQFCTSLTSINVDSGNTVYSSNDGILYNKNQTALLLFPEGKAGAFTIPNNVTTIEKYAFWGCKNLTEINVDTNNMNYSSDIGVLYNKNKTNLIQYPGGKTGAFTISNNVTTIGENAFQNSTNLTSVTIPNSVTEIGELVFRGCTSLTSINVFTNNSTYSTVDGVLYNKNKTILLAFPNGKGGSFTIPNSVTIIKQFAFSNCKNITSVTIPNSVTTIESWAFSDCDSLTSVIIGNSVSTIESGAFNNCHNLASVTFQGTIPKANFSNEFSFPGNLRNIYDGPGTYTSKEVFFTKFWTKQ